MKQVSMLRIESKRVPGCQQPGMTLCPGKTHFNDIKVSTCPVDASAWVDASEPDWIKMPVLLPAPNEGNEFVTRSTTSCFWSLCCQARSSSSSISAVPHQLPAGSPRCQQLPVGGSQARPLRERTSGSWGS